MKKVVIALGGNALQKSKDQATAQAQQRACEQTAEQLLRIIKAGFNVVVTHGNGPQVGNIVLQQEAAATDRTPAMPLDTCGAMSQGMIGYWLQQAIDKSLADAGIPKRAATVITQTVVDPGDPAFRHPTKPIGPFYTEEEARRIMREKGYLFKEDAGRGWRRVVPSPRPVDIVEKDVIRELVENGHIVVCAGGGGIPVIRREDGSFEGVEAVIDKDLGAAKLAELVDADILLILTAVEKVAIHFRQPNQSELEEVTTDQLRRYMQEGHFAPGSMLPKVEATLQFADSRPGRTAVITSLEKGFDALLGKAGTRISARGSGVRKEMPLTS
ncbi:carbamate kinase [Planifilum fulgidum]|jgi:carbamate kinase|uniref:Carbamate kinase n=1 Tax=Planifilum fulgidum TaxID=201973 RepID=A0A1I2M236_9BACL|nr:carbamate kinase [Planifilum fulgidum]MBO2496662.1 carbamate kinase [Bacillota bacterium]MBO2532286.1 carbamate kinase [Thermoactinomycetaceae bacterium]SFF83486.1 carbamate kinase [Planifilum fulgidum]